MKKLSYIIADDDPVYLHLTQQHLQLIPNLHCLAVCCDASQVKAELAKAAPDLLILDIEMPGFTGIQLAKSLVQIPLLIFITSHTHYAADAFEVDAIDYLVKPVAPERLMRAVAKATMLVEMKSTILAAEGFQPAPEDSFFIRDKNAFVRISYADVLFIESLGDFVTIFLLNGEKKIALVSLKNMEQQLPAARFIRISRTQMANRQHITAVDTSFIHLNKLKLHIGKTYTSQVMEVVLGNKAIKRFL
ncbi:MAG: LytTR family DNA-binding domain-containing protein [Ferruginibacter sp.]|nr:LytTR family DNA-binding domain-containing protein [Ferruginibacter sp.]